MAPMKRKTAPTNESFARSKTSTDRDGRLTKRSKAEDSTSEFQNESKPGHSRTIPYVPKILKVWEEESAFPRGGASALTPLEHKQISIDAARDVLFEQEGATRSPKKGHEHEESSHGPKDTITTKRKPKNKSRKGGKDEVEEEGVIKIEGLSYKRLMPGSLVLGQVCEIHNHDIGLVLPNNLIGYVPITSISEKFSENLEKLAAIEDQSDSEMLEDNESVDLRDIFAIGQYLRAYVVSTSAPSSLTEKAKRRIELSLRPREANLGITPKELIPNSTLMGSVLSVEDHGLIIDIGLTDSGIRGFMSSKETGSGVSFSSIREGTVFLCVITGLSSNGNIVKLSKDTQKFASKKKPSYLADAPTVDSFLPGTAVELLVTDVTAKGLAGKVMGMVDVTADLIHSGSGTGVDMEKTYKIGKKTKARIICTFKAASSRKLGVSLLEHVMTLNHQQTKQNGQSRNPLDIMPLSTIIEEVKVKRVLDGVGVFVDLGVEGVPGFVHISRINDKKVENLSETTGPYRIGSTHKGRVVGYNSLDGVFLISLEFKVLDQPFLRIEDVQIGQVVSVKVEKLIVNDMGVGGVLVNLAEGITGLVPEIHLSDVALLHPEKKFKEGLTMKARVLSTDSDSKKIRLTLKKSLVNSEAPPLKSYEDIQPGVQSPGTIVNIIQTGAVVQFYGKVRGFLPVSEMSEAYIQDPAQHFRVGQVVNTYALSVDSEARRFLVSCKDPSSFGMAQQKAFENLKIGALVSAKVTEKSNDDISVGLEGLNLRAVLPVGHLTDGSDSKNRSTFNKIRVGQQLQSLAVLNKLEQKHLITVTSKPTLVQAAKDRFLLRDFDDVKENKVVNGFVKNITVSSVFVEFGSGLTGIVPKNQLPESSSQLPDFGLKKFQSFTVRVIAIDRGQRRFLLSAKETDPAKLDVPDSLHASGSSIAVSNPVDETIKTTFDLKPGRLTTARIVSIKETQINVQLADNIQGRIDVSQIFDKWEEIKDRKHPLRQMTAKQLIKVRILGVHDARNHRFLPISHRSGKTPVFELSAKPTDQVEAGVEVLTLDKIKIGSSWIAFVNNVGDDCLWVNLSPNVRGRVYVLDISEDVSLFNDLEASFPIGSAIRVHVKNINLSNNRLDLSARSLQSTASLTFHTISKDMILPGIVTKVNERHVMVQLTENLSGPVFFTDLADDFSKANPMNHSKNDILRVCVTEVDIPNKRIRLSTRPSRVLDSSSPVKDPEVTSISQLHVNDVVRGFVKNVADNGVFVNLGGNVTAYVRVSDLSDSYLKDWKSNFQVDQLVEGKVVLTDPVLNHIQLSLKSSVLDKNYTPLITFTEIKVGQVITGKIRKVQDFGVFIVVDGSNNVSGLCHKSEMAEGRVENVQKLYEEGDAVKAKVLKIDVEKRRISFGLKASYFEVAVESEDGNESEESEVMNGVALDTRESSDDEENGGVEIEEMDTDLTDDDQIWDRDADHTPELRDLALDAGAFDWTATIFDSVQDSFEDTSFVSNDRQPAKSKAHRKPLIKVDLTGDLDANGPQSASDFERLLLGQPDSSQLWIEYMAFQVKLGELPKARDVGERAIRTISIREETDKLNVWIALLNLENTYGTNETMEEVFKRACQYNDSQEIHERVSSIYVLSGKHTKADDLFQILVKKFSQSPAVWYNYAQFLHHTLSSPDRARLLLPRAIQSLPSHTHLNLTVKFAALEFHSPNGSPERGRTMFEGILSTFPRRLDLWNQLLDLEMQQNDADIIRTLFHRVIKTKGLKIKGAKAWFKRWNTWEMKNGDSKSQAQVQLIAQDWIRDLTDTKRGDGIVRGLMLL